MLLFSWRMGQGAQGLVLFFTMGSFIAVAATLLVRQG
jgi:hypothetical protein